MSDTPAPASTTVCIAGCGPAGAMLSLMLARAGVDVVVLEQYPDFFRDFRGDTIHASTLQVLDELGLLPGFQKLPQQKTTKISMVTDQGTFTLGDFTQLPGKFQSLSMVPQWDFLDFITTEAEKYPTFRLQFSATGPMTARKERSGRSSPSPRTAATPPSGAPRASPRWSTAHPSTSSGTECRRAPKTPTV